MTRRFHHLLLAAAFGAAVATTTVVMATPPAAPEKPACLAVGAGVCFSGSTTWVAQAAAIVERENEVRFAMSGDAE